jgi:hypothetical protein
MSSITHNKKEERPSLFGPIILIAIGLFFLFNRLNPITDLHWGDVLRLWPLFLIFIGLNILVEQAPRPLGMLLSGVVALAAVAVFGYVLIQGISGPIFGRTFDADWQSQEVSFPVEGLRSAVLDIEIGPPGADIFALEDSRDLIAGTVTYQNGLLFDKRGSGDRVTVEIAPRDTDWFWESANWGDQDDAARWDLGLNPNIPLTLDLTAAAGSSVLDLRELIIEALSLQLSAGELSLMLPGGDYDVDLQTSAGSTEVTLPESGRHTITIRVSAGSVMIEAPEGVELRIEVDQALGSFNNHLDRLERVGDSNIWQTAGYDDSANRVDLVLNISVGSVELR